MLEELMELLHSQSWIEIMRWDFGIPERNIRRFRYGLKTFTKENNNHGS